MGCLLSLPAAFASTEGIAGGIPLPIQQMYMPSLQEGTFHVTWLLRDSTMSRGAAQVGHLDRPSRK